MMNPFMLVFPALLVAAAVVYGVFRAIGRVWLDHKAKLTLLEKLEKHPELIPSFRELQNLVESASVRDAKAQRQDYVLTGILLGAIGIGCVVSGRVLSMGRIAVGMYFGGLVCICLGFILALAGLLIRNMSRPPAPVSKDE
ncbi:MAG: hypothetical protein QG656_2715 [Candidatus Hydrogenedentes bacterium]|nr:hypothetical protein [Candidatus Hydrogenedentota bacterium]